MAVEEKKFLGTAGVQQLITNTRTEIAAAEQAAKDYADGLADNYDAAGTAATKVNELAQGQVKTNTEHIGTMDNLETTAKADLVTAINEVRNAVSAGGTAAAITMEEKTSDLGEGVLKAYVLKQGDNTVGTINIPKDMVVQSGEVVTNPEGQDAGTYIKLTLANATNDVIYVNVGTLVDIYKAKASAAQVQIAIDSATREISATIVAGSVTATELAADAVVTAKIADGNVTKAKLSTEVQGELNKAHEHANATQLATYDKTQTELLAAAKTEAGDLDYALKQELEGYIFARPTSTDIENIYAKKTYVDGQINTLNTSTMNYINTQVGPKITENANDIDKLEASLAEGGATANAIADAKKAGTDAKDHADGLNTAMNTRVEALESVTYVEITADDIDTMFAS